MSQRRDTFADLPILEEVGDDLERAFRAQEGSVRRPWWRRRALVVAIATGIAVLLVPTAIATKSLWSPAADTASPDHPARPTAPIQLDTPQAPSGSFRLSASETSRGLCLHTFITGGGLGEACTPHVSTAHPLTVMTGGGAHAGYVAGPVVPSASTLRVTAGGRTQTVNAFAPDPERLARAQIPADFKLFVAFFPTTQIDPATVEVEARDAQGRVVGHYPAR
jgi:hypothetical protein